MIDAGGIFNVFEMATIPNKLHDFIRTSNKHNKNQIKSRFSKNNYIINNNLNYNDHHHHRDHHQH